MSVSSEAAGAEQGPDEGSGSAKSAEAVMDQEQEKVRIVIPTVYEDIKTQEEAEPEPLSVEQLLESLPEETLEDIEMDTGSETKKLIEKFVDENPEAVIVSFDKTLTYKRLCEASWFIYNGVPGFSTHPDVFCPTDQPTRLVDCGAISRCVELATGKTLRQLGKPDAGFGPGADLSSKADVTPTFTCDNLGELQALWP